jgi:anti-anti-sigma factor
MDTADRLGASCTLVGSESEVVTIRLEGELDAVSVPHLEREIDPELVARCPRLLLDLSAVAFIDSFGIRLIVQVLRLRDGGPVELIRPEAPGGARPLEIVGLDKLVRCLNGR